MKLCNILKQNIETTINLPENILIYLTNIEQANALSE